MTNTKSHYDGTNFIYTADVFDDSTNFFWGISPTFEKVDPNMHDFNLSFDVKI